VYKSNIIYGCLLYIYYQLDLYVKDIIFPNNTFVNYNKIVKKTLNLILNSVFSYSIVELGVERVIINEKELNKFLWDFIFNYTKHGIDRLTLIDDADLKSAKVYNYIQKLN